MRIPALRSPCYGIDVSEGRDDREGSPLRDPEDLRLLRTGTEDIAVGVSGFGSARMDGGVWRSLAQLTGRTTYVMRYDAQELPWAEDEVPRSLSDLASVGGELFRRWTAARMGAADASTFLEGWIRRWLAAGRRVLVVGFSLGGYVAWRAVRDIGDPRVEVVLISAAIGDTPAFWKGADTLGRVVNVYSREDLVLRWLYPLAVGGDETPAAGLGPLRISETVSTVLNVDATDLVGADHLRASVILGRLVRMALGCLRAGTMEGGTCAVPGVGPVTDLPTRLSAEQAARLCRWVHLDVTLWNDLGVALEEEEPGACARMLALDVWGEPRLGPLSELGTAALVLSRAVHGREVALRSRQEILGFLRIWRGHTLPVVLTETVSAGSG